MNFLEKGRFTNVHGFDLNRSVIGSEITRVLKNREGLPKEVLIRKIEYVEFKYDIVRVGACVVHKFPIYSFPSEVMIPSGSPEEVFAGFVLQDMRAADEHNRHLGVTVGDFTAYTMQYDPHCPFEFEGKVYAGPKGLVTTVPGAYIGTVVSLPTMKDPFLGLQGQTQG